MFQHSRVLSLIFLAQVCLLVSACDLQDDFQCPNRDDEISWRMYGGWKLQDEGNDSIAKKLRNECGWEVWNEHEGGYGDTYQVSKFGGGLIFIWAWNNFSGFIASKGWEGKTEEGIKLGDSIGTFLDTYPYFSECSSCDNGYYYDNRTNTFLYRDIKPEDLVIKIEAHFNNLGSLCRLEVYNFAPNLPYGSGFDSDAALPCE